MRIAHTMDVDQQRQSDGFSRALVERINSVVGMRLRVGRVGVSELLRPPPPTWRSVGQQVMKDRQTDRQRERERERGRERERERERERQRQRQTHEKYIKSQTKVA